MLLLRLVEFGKIGDTISMGNVRELRNQVFVEFRNINRKYPDHHRQNTLLHIVCQEGYHSMVSYMLNPANRNDVDNNKLEISPKNDRGRSPLFLCFTPPTATVRFSSSSFLLFYAAERPSLTSCLNLIQATGLQYGLSNDGNILASRPEDIERENDWVAPGGPKSRETCIKLLLENGADPNEKDFQDFTALHYAAMWGWTTTAKLLMEKGGDINAITSAGRTPLMYAVDFDQEDLVLWLAAQANKLRINVDAVDTEGCSALILAVEKGDNGIAMAKALLEAGADPNVLTLRRKSALKIACSAQNLELVNLLLDHHVLRRKSAFNLLRDDAFNKLQHRLAEEEKKEEEAQKRAAKEDEQKMRAGVGRNKRIYEAWVEYRDKKSKKPFYYNTITRKSQWEKPKDFKPDRTRLVKDVTFGMSFYH